jgi:hypothetical protein
LKTFLYSFVTLFFLISCNRNKTIVDKIFVDSLLANYSEPASIKLNQQEIEFWENRIDPKNTGLVNELKYATSLGTRFLLTGCINDIKTSDSVLKKADNDFNHREASPYLALIRHNILQHRFKEADSLLILAKKVGLKKYELFTTSFDVDFELGRYFIAERELKNLKSANDYGYFFRCSKMEHYKGDLDAAANTMLKAAEQAGSDIFLKQAALSNAADLYVHEGKLNKAYDLYVESIHLNPGDLHSIINIGWISLVHDKNDSLAEKIFQFVSTKTKSPDPLYKLIFVPESRSDIISEQNICPEICYSCKR